MDRTSMYIDDSASLEQWRSRTFGRLVQWSNLLPYCLRFWKMNSLFKVKPRVLMPKVTCSI